MDARRRLLLKFSSSPQPQTGYVQSGLVFHLDGIDKGNISGSWVDLAGGLVIPMTNAVFDTNGVDFSPSGSCGILLGTPIGVTPADGTMEVCLSNTARNNTFCLIRGKNSEIRYYHTGSNGRHEISNSTSDTSWYDGVNVYDKYTVSLSQARGIFNGNSMEATTGRTWMSSITSDCVLIGGAGGTSNPASTGRYAGTVHSIRIYSRQLSAEEILQNQRYDNTRFSLGLTI